MGIPFPVRIPAILKAELAGNAVSLPAVWIVGALGISQEASAALMVGIDSVPCWVVLVLLELRIGRGFFSSLRKVGKELFGAELLDTFLLRPALLYGCSTVFGMITGGMIGSLAADIIYVSVVLISKRIMR